MGGAGGHLFTIMSDGKAGWSCPLVIVMVIVNTALYGGHNWRCCHCQRKENDGVAVSLYCVAHLLSYADPRDGWERGGGVSVDVEEFVGVGVEVELVEWRWERRVEWGDIDCDFRDVEIENEFMHKTFKHICNQGRS